MVIKKKKKMFFKKLNLIEVINYIIKNITILGLRTNVINNNVYFCIPNKFNLIFLNFFKNNSLLNFNCLTDLFGNDLIYTTKRFNIIYSLLNVFNNYRFFIKTTCSKLEKIFSSIFIFKSANWFEREIFDMFGILFLNHFDLRKILTDYGFKGFPLRKDFPLVGFKQLRYDEISQTLIYEKVLLTQKYRFFSLNSALLPYY